MSRKRSVLRFRRAACFAAILLCLEQERANAVGSFTIELNPASGLSANADALAAFERAAQEWEARISSPITIQITADLRSTSLGNNPFAPNTIGQTSFTTYTNDLSDINLPYETVRTALVQHAARPGDAVLAFLPTSLQVTAEVPAGATFINTSLGVVRANQRALGLIANDDTRADGAIVFNSGFAFDFDRSDGVSVGKIDFQTAAAHEIGHVLGFQSDVDDFDVGASEDNLTTLDLYRFPASHSPTNPVEFQNFARELRPGVESLLTDTSVGHAMSTGVNQGDGRQASHWKDDFIQQNGNITIGPLIGIMDPTLSDGTFESVVDSDFRAMDLIGYNVESVPEPRSATLILLAVGMLALRSRQASQTTAAPAGTR
ncbi:MAG: hypothetical protein QOD99_3150 [Chthoniobacter sp.]|jgi:hypothetical protein|nr:hypothetical protein [Chthoniobacter sp.]